FLSLYAHASKLISGNATVTGETFAFSIGKTLISQGNSFYISASLDQGEISQINDFSIAKLGLAENNTLDQFIPLAPERITIERVPDKPNPLFDQRIVTFSLLESSDGWF